MFRLSIIEKIAFAETLMVVSFNFLLKLDGAETGCIGMVDYQIETSQRHFANSPCKHKRGAYKSQMQNVI